VSARDRDRLPLLADGVAHLRRYATVLALLTVLGGVCGTAAYVLSPTRYDATSAVALAPRLAHVPLDVDTTEDREVTLDTMAALVRSDQVVSAIRLTTGLSDDEIRARLTLSARPASRVLLISFRGDTREQAVSASHTAVEALLAQQDRVLALSSEQVRLLRNQVNLVSAQAQERTEQGDDVTGLYEALVLLQDRLDRTVESTRTPSTVIRRAEVRAYRADRPEVLIGSGLALGLTVGLAVGRLHAARALRRWTPAPAAGPALAPVLPLTAVLRRSLHERPART
jgi:hypothetical protein